jgi:diaminohydroxyphosphoribosylaminopyrimidine deaminase / 5-amino-6-(5-phosphoribosylamino)uracil reductase
LNAEGFNKGVMTVSTSSTVSEQSIARAMQAALAAAREFEGATAPNPAVGCALLNAQGEVITAAGHQGAGKLHAEAEAIRLARAAGRADQIHTVVVTLEPCNHHGRTPPCTEAILSTPARHVVYGVGDPNPRVAGGGAARLQAAGLDVGLYQGDRSDLNRLIAPFAKRVLRGIPFVTVKQALTGDGSMIPPAGQKTFTSPASLRLAHELRRRADAIVTGSGTILADNPEFTVRRVPDHAGKHRGLFILDRRGRVPKSYITAAEQRGFQVLLAPDFAAALQMAADAGALEVLVEAGPQLTRHVLQSPHWDEHVRITQTNGEDRVEILTNGGADVFRHH